MKLWIVMQQGGHPNPDERFPDRALGLYHSHELANAAASKVNKDCFYQELAWVEQVEVLDELA